MRLLRVLSRSGYPEISTDGSHKRDFVTWMQLLGQSQTACAAEALQGIFVELLKTATASIPEAETNCFVTLYDQEDFCA